MRFCLISTCKNEIEQQQKLCKEVVFRADAAFAKAEIYEALEERGVKYAIRLPANDSLERDIAELPTRRKESSWPRSDTTASSLSTLEPE